MSNNQENKYLKELSIEKLFRSGNYIVPIYQRNYAWSEKEITQLIDDINDYCKENKKNKDKKENEKNYYIGTLVVYKKYNIYEVIDGQQRLTTLYILISVLKNKFEKGEIHFVGESKEKLQEALKEIFENINFNLKFESREKSQKALKEIFESKISPKDELNTSIINGYEIIEKKLKQLENEELGLFVEYLFLNVQILRVEVPQDTDLNHYFEIMNNRGEQLEKHEILKSRMLNVIKENPDDTKLFNTIWEACANMDSYVQYGFSIEERTTIFGNNWNEFKIDSFDNLKPKETKQDTIKIPKNEDDKVSEECKKPTIQNLITCYSKVSPSNIKQNNADSPERFNSVINFPNFLLHVLKIQENEKNNIDDKTVPLDDKKLLEVFKEKISTTDHVKEFAYNLLKIKFLFDNYIIKREYTSKGDSWSLKQLVINDNKESKNNTAYYKNRFDEKLKLNETVLMLLSMFHVSAPTMIYKHWLSASLKYLFKETQQILADSYIIYLEKLAKAYMKDRYLSINPKEYHEIIYINNGESKNDNINYEYLDKGTAVENFIFNYLDYLLWKDENIKINKTNFSFAFRSSVEHYYPQNPMENIDPLGKTTLNCFGNLCLVTNSENSRLSNFTPNAKKEFYLKQQNQSIKQRIMMSSKEWNEVNIKEHQNRMIDILKRDTK